MLHDGRVFDDLDSSQNRAILDLNKYLGCGVRKRLAYPFTYLIPRSHMQSRKFVALFCDHSSTSLPCSTSIEKLLRIPAFLCAATIEWLRLSTDQAYHQ